MLVKLYKKYYIDKIKSKINDNTTKIEYRNKDNMFIRNRKMSFEKVILYGLNKRGLTSKMEIEDFTELINMTDISAPTVLKQRLKLNGKIYLDMMQENLKGFYKEFKSEVKLFHGYILAAIDGSDFEIPNTKNTRSKYNALHPEKIVARATISNMFDVLNHYVMDTIIGKYDTSEREMAKENYNNIKKLDLPYPIIRTMDRGYVSIVDMYYSDKNDDKYVVRLRNKDFKKQIQKMKSNDEIIEVPYQYDRVRYYKKDYLDFYKIMEETKEDIQIRIVVINKKNGEKITLATNLTQEEINYDEMIELYKLRWEIELNYHSLKEILKIETITSSNDIIIYQDIYSRMLVYNLIQAFKQDAEKKIDQTKYKNEMKINMNMATGFVKKALVKIILEENADKQNRMFELLEQKIEKYLIPIKKDRHYPRNKDKKNKYPMNKRKSF